MKSSTKRILVILTAALAIGAILYATGTIDKIVSHTEKTETYQRAVLASKAFQDAKLEEQVEDTSITEVAFPTQTAPDGGEGVKTKGAQ